jgi:Tfp pilus assembly protein PilF
MLEWTERGLVLAAAEPDAAYCAGPLLNNLGWHHFERGDYEEALAVFERALAARQRDPANPQAIVWAQEAIDEARKAPGARR